MSLSRDELIFLAKICEQTERFEDMLDHMKKVAYLDQELSIDERNLLSVAYKNTVGTRRTAWRAISSIETKEEAKNSKYLPLLRDYKEKIEKELNKYCDDILQVLDKKLIPASSGSYEANVFYLKMKGDYYRYIAEYATKERNNMASAAARSIFPLAHSLARRHLHALHPVRLGVALSYCRWVADGLGIKKDAFNIAKLAYSEAISEMEQIYEYEDIRWIVQALFDEMNLAER